EARLRAASPGAEAWGACRSLIAALDGSDDREAARLRLRQAIRRVVEEVRCLFGGKGEIRLAAVQLEFDGGARRGYLILYRPARAPAAGVTAGPAAAGPEAEGGGAPAKKRGRKGK